MLVLAAYLASLHNHDVSGHSLAAGEDLQVARKVILFSSFGPLCLQTVYWLLTWTRPEWPWRITSSICATVQCSSWEGWLPQYWPRGTCGWHTTFRTEAHHQHLLCWPSSVATKEVTGFLFGFMVESWEVLHSQAQLGPLMVFKKGFK